MARCSNAYGMGQELNSIYYNYTTRSVRYLQSSYENLTSNLI